MCLAHLLPKESRMPGTVFSRHTFCHDGGAFFLTQQGPAPQPPPKNFSDFQTLGAFRGAYAFWFMLCAAVIFLALLHNRGK